MELQNCVFNKSHQRISQTLFGCWILLSVPPCFADLHGIITGTTNYIYRGYTKSNDGPAIQGNLDYQHPSGLYLGASVSNVKFAERRFRDSSSVVEFIPYLGYTFPLDDDWRADVQWTRYLFDNKIFGREADYNEFYLLVHYRDLLTLRASISDSYYNQGIVSGDYEITGRYPLTQYFEISGGAGYSQVEKVLAWDFLYWNAGITGRYKCMAADLRYTQSIWTTDTYRTGWRYRPDEVPATLVFSLSVGF